MEIYIIRHGQTYWNEKKLFQGSVDIELNESGRRLAGIAGEELESVHFDEIFSSPLIRAYETACLVRGHRNIKITRDDRLKEMSFGASEGKTVKELFENKENPFHYFFEAPEKFVPDEGGETFDDVTKRAKDFLKEVVEPLEGKYERIMIAGHGALNKSLLRAMHNVPLEKYWGEGLQDNCGICIVSLKDGKYEILDQGKLKKKAGV